MKILAAKLINTGNGGPKVLVQTAKQDIWVPFGQWKSSCQSPIPSYIGGDIEPDFYKEGETLLNEQVCTKNDTILRSFVASENPLVIAIAQSYSQEKLENEASDKAALLSRQRASSRAQTNTPSGSTTEQPKQEQSTTEDTTAATANVATNVPQTEPAQ